VAHQPIRVLFRFTRGLPFRQASDEEKKWVDTYWTETARRWKSRGVKLLGYFGAYGHAVDGFCHHYVFEVDDVDTVRQMNADIYRGKGGKYLEHFSFHVGQGHGSEEWWASL
jgi:hypothetical protein